MNEPLLALTGARIEAGDAVLADALDLTLEGPRAVIVGDASGLVALLAGTARLAHGDARVNGRPLDDARADVCVARRDPPLLGDLSPLAHVAWSARLAGMSSRDADAAAARACELAALGPWLRRPLGSVPLAVRRASVLAAAAVTQPMVLIAEAPLVGLDATSAVAVLTALGRLVGDRAAIVSTPEPEPGSPAATLVEGASGVAYV